MMNNNLFVSHYKRRKKSFFRELLELIITIAITVTITLFILGNVFSITKISGQSMEPTIFDGDKVFNYKLGYNFTEPKSGEIVIICKCENKKGLILNTIAKGKDIIDNIYGKITNNFPEKYIIKRVIATPGDTIDIKEGYITVNGEKLEESYIKGRTFESSEFSYPLTIPENKLFVLGDNRENSLDSRILGLIDYERIKGKVVFRLWPLKRIGVVH